MVWIVSWMKQTLWRCHFDSQFPDFCVFILTENSQLINPYKKKKEFLYKT